MAGTGQQLSLCLFKSSKTLWGEWYDSEGLKLREVKIHRGERLGTGRARLRLFLKPGP